MKRWRFRIEFEVCARLHPLAIRLCRGQWCAVHDWLYWRALGAINRLALLKQGAA